MLTKALNYVNFPFFIFIFLILENELRTGSGNPVRIYGSDLDPKGSGWTCNFELATRLGLNVGLIRA